jgi:ABC-type multidrug transport system ATPase subunit
MVSSELVTGAATQLEMSSATTHRGGDVEEACAEISPALSFREASFSVRDKVILRKVSGHVGSNQVCAILGPSGSGKTTLLNVLAGRSSSRPPNVKVSVHMEADGVKTNPVSFRKNVAYVMQDDALMATATPREALLFSATLRLSVSEEARTKRVEEMLGELDLLGCADVYIGGPLVKGISGGQRKRTAVGVELVTKPGLVFLDEPTSG